MTVFEYIEGWYDPHRRHTGLGYLSHLEFERSNQQAASMPKRNCPLERGNSIPAVTDIGSH